METPSGHPSPLTQISTNSKQPKTPHSESSQAAPQTQISNIYTETQILPLSTHLKLHPSKHRQKAQLPTHPLHSQSKAKPKLQTSETNNFRKHFLHHKP